MTNDAAIAQYLHYIERLEYAPTTIYTRRRQLQRLAHMFAPRHLFDLTDVDLDDWTERDLAKCGPKGRATAIAHVRAFYRWAEVHDHLGDKPNPSRRLRRPRLPRALPRPITEEDLYLALETAPKRIRPWIALAGWAGLRACEIARLRREDILDDATPPMIVVRGKGSKERLVPLGPALLAELRRHGLPTTGYVFPRGDGQPGPNQPHRVSKLVNVHLHGLGLKTTLHKMRHRFGTQIYAITKDIRVTQEVLGHSSPATTAIYAAFSNSSAAAAVVELDHTLPAPGRLRLLSSS
ncbi:MAG TPA: tyrosine-type recombinase/integrase [Mycobacteriales bacterium]|nr:tyrosine-type recombinase/integrase [Mycobacteriales bacterium]